MTPSRLKRVLEKFYREYDFSGRIPHDPIRFPLRYKNPRDIEVSAFIASSFAYGRVDLFMRVVEQILSLMGNSPYDFLRCFALNRYRRLLEGIQYRFNKNDDIISFLFLLHRILERHSSLESAFYSFYSHDDPDIGRGLAGFMNAFLKKDTSQVYGKNSRPPGLLQFFPSPANGSACKRANLFLRWMVRDRDIDFGIWKELPKNKLVIPLDTHIARISRCLGFSERKTQDWKMALEVTAALKRFDPEDPVKYDFALCHQGISGLCGKGEESCRNCLLKS